MGQRQHGLVAVGVGLLCQMVDNGLGCGQPHLLHTVLHATGDGQVVDILGRAGKMHESLQSGQLGVMTQHIGGLLQLVVDVILHGLHIMVGLSLISGMLGNAFGSEILRNGTQIRLLIIGERLDTRNDGLIAVALETVGKQNHPLDFDAHALAVQRRFAHVFDKGSGLLVVAAVKRGQCDCGGDVSKLHRQQHTFSREPLVPSFADASLIILDLLQLAFHDLLEMTVMVQHGFVSGVVGVPVSRFMVFRVVRGVLLPRRITDFGSWKSPLRRILLMDGASYGEPVLRMGVSLPVKCRDAFIIHLDGGDPCFLGNLEIRYRGAKRGDMLDVVFILEIRRRRCRDDAALRMADDFHGIIRLDAGLFHGLIQETEAFRGSALPLIGTHQLEIGVPVHRRIVIAVGPGNDDPPSICAIGFAVLAACDGSVFQTAFTFAVERSFGQPPLVGDGVLRACTASDHFGFRIHTGYGEIVSMVFVEVRYEQSVDFLKTAIDRAFAGKPLCYSRSRFGDHE